MNPKELSQDFHKLSKDPSGAGSILCPELVIEEGLSLSEFIRDLPSHPQAPPSPPPLDELDGVRSDWLAVSAAVSKVVQQVPQQVVEVKTNIHPAWQLVDGMVRRMADIKIGFDGPVDWGHCSLDNLHQRLRILGSGLSRFPDELTVSVPLASAPVSRNGVILVVDDEHCMLKVMDRALSDSGYTVVSVFGGEEAVQYASGSPENIALVFCDLILFAQSGLDVLTNLRQAGVDCPKVLMSGSPLLSEKQVTNATRENSDLSLLAKPFRIRQLLSLVDVLTRGSLLHNPKDSVGLKAAD